MKLEKPLVEAWIIGLDGLSAESIMKAKVEILQNRANPFMPSSGEFRAVCNDIERKERKKERESHKLLEYQQERENAGKAITFSEWRANNPDGLPKIFQDETFGLEAPGSSDNGDC